MWVDSHCHLDFADFDGDRDAVVARAKAAGIGRLVTISTRVKAFERVRRLIDTYEDVYGSVGTHPHNADEETDVDAATLVALARHPKIVAIGEAGLDFHYRLSTPENQERSFRAHIAAARETNLPLVIHARDADERMIALLRSEAGEGPFPGVLHCFASGPDLAEAGLALGLYISFSGILTFKSAVTLHEIARAAPADRILVETDAPYLAPVPHRGKRNEPSYVVRTAAALANIRGATIVEIERQTTENFFRLFRRVPSNDAG